MTIETLGDSRRIPECPWDSGGGGSRSRPRHGIAMIPEASWVSRVAPSEGDDEAVGRVLWSFGLFYVPDSRAQ